MSENFGQLAEKCAAGGRGGAGRLSPSSLAYIGDAVFELLVRDRNASSGDLKPHELHKRTVVIVSAKAQARISGQLLDILSEEELRIFKRGRNAAVHSMPKNAEIADYCKATGVEALFGYLYISGETDRLFEIFEFVWRLVSD